MQTSSTYMKWNLSSVEKVSVPYSSVVSNFHSIYLPFVGISCSLQYQQSFDI